MIVRVLSVREPFASQIARGEKTIELRTWVITPGPLAIASCATRGKRGKMLCLVDVVECEPGEGHRLAMPEDSAAACCEITEDDDYWAIELANRRPLKQVEVTGKQGLWYAEVELL